MEGAGGAAAAGQAAATGRNVAIPYGYEDEPEVRPAVM